MRDNNNHRTTKEQLRNLTPNYEAKRLRGYSGNTRLSRLHVAFENIKNIAVFHATHAPCHTCSPAMHAPFHGHPLPCMPPATHTPCHACLPTTHAPLPCTPPSMDTPCHACPLPHMSPCHACPLPHFVVGGNYSKSSENQYRWLSSPQ